MNLYQLIYNVPFFKDYLDLPSTIQLSRTCKQFKSLQNSNLLLEDIVSRFNRFWSIKYDGCYRIISKKEFDHQIELNLPNPYKIYDRLKRSINNWDYCRRKKRYDMITYINPYRGEFGKLNLESITQVLDDALSHFDDKKKEHYEKMGLIGKYIYFRKFQAADMLSNEIAKDMMEFVKDKPNCRDSIFSTCMISTVTNKQVEIITHKSHIVSKLEKYAKGHCLEFKKVDIPTESLRKYFGDVNPNIIKHVRYYKIIVSF